MKILLATDYPEKSVSMVLAQVKRGIGLRKMSLLSPDNFKSDSGELVPKALNDIARENEEATIFCVLQTESKLPHLHRTDKLNPRVIVISLPLNKVARQVKFILTKKKKSPPH